MTLEDVIESLNRYIESRRSNNMDCLTATGYFVLHKSITPDTTFKAYKTIEYTLWIVDKHDKYRFFTKQLKTKLSIDHEEHIIDYFEREFLTDLYKVLLTKSHNDRIIFEDIVYGEYLSYCDE